MIKLVLNIQAEFSALGVRNGHSYSCCNAFPHSISRNCKYLLVSWEHGDNFQFSERSTFCVPASCQECLAALLSLECPPSCAEAASSSMLCMLPCVLPCLYVEGSRCSPKRVPCQFLKAHNPGVGGSGSHTLASLNAVQNLSGVLCSAFHLMSR